MKKQFVLKLKALNMLSQCESVYRDQVPNTDLASNKVAETGNTEHNLGYKAHFGIAVGEMDAPGDDFENKELYADEVNHSEFSANLMVNCPKEFGDESQKDPVTDAFKDFTSGFNLDPEESAFSDKKITIVLAFQVDKDADVDDACEQLESTMEEVKMMLEQIPPVA